MKRLLKICTFVLALVMLFSFAACGESQNPPQEEVHAESISLAGMQTQFAYGDEFSADGLTVTVRYSDGTSRKASPLEYTVDSSAYKANVAGSYEIAVKFGALTSKYTVTVAEQAQGEPEAVSLALSGMKLNFTVGESFSAEGIVVTAHYSDGNDRVLSSEEYEIDFSAYKSDTAGDYEIVVKFGVIEHSYTVTVAKGVQNTWEEDGVLKILMIGNSYTQDTAEYVWEIADSLGLECYLALCFIGGTSIDDHLKNIQDDAPLYNYCTKTSDVWNNTFGNRMSVALKAQDWDFITIQQQSFDSGRKESYVRLGEYVEYVHSMCPRAQLGWIMPWADAEYSDFRDQFPEGQMQMYNAVLEATQSEVVEKFDLAVIPSGTAIQNARTSFLGDTLNRDGHHLTLGLGRYISGLTLISRFTGLPLKGLGYRPSGQNSVSAREQLVAIESAENAVKTPFAVTQSKYR